MNEPGVAIEASSLHVEELERDGAVPILGVDRLEKKVPGLIAGITWRGNAEPFDMGVFGAVPVGTSMARWRALRQTTGFRSVVHARQVHGARILHHGTLLVGLFVGDDADGHVTGEPGTLLTVSVADCVPVWVVAPGPRIALLHAGWRGVARGILEAGIDALAPADVASLEMHLGPAICGQCYEVGPEVHDALGLAVPDRPTPVDLRAVLADRAARAGIPARAVSVSSLCTRCSSERLFSHRGGSAGRQIAFAGIRQHPP